jgi:signal transduction histidine kinase
MINFEGLATKTLIKTASRISFIILLGTILNYIHVLKTSEEHRKETLAKYIQERTSREQIVFIEAEKDHEYLISEFLESYQRYLKNPNLSSLFKSIATKSAYDIYRNKNSNFDGKKTSGIYLNAGSSVTKEVMAKILAGYDISTRMGPAFHHNFQDTYFTYPENGIVLYWPEFPKWAVDLNETYDVRNEEYYAVATEKHDPEKKTIWSRLFYDKVSKTWMVTASTPIYIDGVHIASVHHDLMVTELVDRVMTDDIDGAQNFIVRADGTLIVHPGYFSELIDSQGTLNLSNPQSEKLQDLATKFLLIKDNPGQSVIASNKIEGLLGVGKIEGPNWYLVTDYPKKIIRDAAIKNSFVLLTISFLSWVIELILLFFIIYKEVSVPLRKFINTTETIAKGNFNSRIRLRRTDELGMLASAFNRMTAAIRQRDQQLAKHNADLENLIETRTKERDQERAMNIHASRLAAIGEMAGGLAHEINTPLATIKLLTSQALQEAQGDIPDLGLMLQQLTMTDRTVDRLSKIVKSLKTFAREGSTDPFEATDVKELINDSVSLLVERFRSHNIDLQIKVSDPSPTIFCRPIQIGQVLVNLLNNAHDAMEASETKRIEISATDKGDMVEIRVTDSGPGIPPEIREKIFNPFFTTKSVDKGTGMGLSISHGILNSHHGKITLDKDSEQTSFIIILPKVQQQAA